jgi:AcrR family transcriptional regulator
MDQRAKETDATRRRLLTAASELLASPEGGERFTVEEVARRADVARQTVYYQFGSKSGLIAALCDHLAERGGIVGLADAFVVDDPAESLDRLTGVFARFWEADRVVTRRLRALGALDPDIGKVISERDNRRRDALKVVLERHAARYGIHESSMAAETLSLLVMLTSFEAFDTLAGERPITDALPSILALIKLLLRPNGR